MRIEQVKDADCRSHFNIISEEYTVINNDHKQQNPNFIVIFQGFKKCFSPSLAHLGYIYSTRLSSTSGTETAHMRDEL